MAMAAAAVPYIMAATAAVTAYGAIRQGQAASAAADYNAKVAEQNKQAALAQGQAQSEAQWRASQQRIGSAIALYGGAGVQGDSGSAADVLGMNIQNATLDNLTTQYNAQMRGIGFDDQAELDHSNASNARTSSYLSAGGALLQGMGSAAYAAKGNPAGTAGGFAVPNTLQNG
jgi:hypothetical protein